MIKENYNLDIEEQEILDSFNCGEWISKKEDLDKYKKAAKQTFKKTHSVNFCLSEKDFKNIQIRAIEEGISYQEFLSSIVHKYLSDQLKKA
ncbi:hypothetical protein QUF74_06950 [Candidatus Halobeggiatoa sp. HSG11]|nr:hypothetical protein [Candidatus Halobeggiatoa sp. HSG11]